MVEPDQPEGLSIALQCQLLSINRSSYYYQPNGEPALNIELMRLIDQQYLETPWYGARQMARHLRRQSYCVWCADITYIPMRRGFFCLVAIMDWHSRKVLSWRLFSTIGHRFLRCGPGRSLGTAWPAGDLQHRPGQPVHQ